jgi:hypothetical protein
MNVCVICVDFSWDLWRAWSQGFDEEIHCQISSSKRIKKCSAEFLVRRQNLSPDRGFPNTQSQCRRFDKLMSQKQTIRELSVLSSIIWQQAARASPRMIIDVNYFHCSPWMNRKVNVVWFLSSNHDAKRRATSRSFTQPTQDEPSR